MDQGLLAKPNSRSFLRFTSRGLFIPDGTIHGYDLGAILMVNSALGAETNKIPYAVNGDNVTAFQETISVSPEWTIKGNQFSTRIRELLLLGTKQTDAVQNVGTGLSQTVTGVVLGATYRLNIFGALNFTATVGTAKTAGVDYEFDPLTGNFRPLEGGTIAAGANVVCGYDLPAVTRERYTAFNRQNRSGNLYLSGLRSGDTFLNEEWIINGMLTTDDMGSIDPKKNREWSMKMYANGLPDVYMPKT